MELARIRPLSSDGDLNVTQLSVSGRCRILPSHRGRVELPVHPASSPHQLAAMNSVARTFEAEKPSGFREAVSERRNGPN